MYPFVVGLRAVIWLGLVLLVPRLWVRGLGGETMVVWGGGEYGEREVGCSVALGLMELLGGFGWEGLLG